MVKIEEQEEEENSNGSTNNNKKPSSSMSQHNESPHSSTSSISSDHTFHGFSPSKSNPASPVLVPLSPVHNHDHDPNLVLSTARFVRDQPPEVVTRTESDAETGFAKAKKPKRNPVQGDAKRGKVLLNRVGLVLRVCEIVVCLVSFCVMASDKRRGWALDSFSNYIEFRYSMTINVIGFAYAALQGLDLIVQLTMGKNLARSQLRCCIDFAMDQILAYLLLSSSSSAFTRIDDWISNWGKDKFPAIASASVGVSFVAFIAFALSSLISGNILCMRRH